MNAAEGRGEGFSPRHGLYEVKRNDGEKTRFFVVSRLT